MDEQNQSGKEPMVPENRAGKAEDQITKRSYQPPGFWEYGDMVEFTGIPPIANPFI